MGELDLGAARAARREARGSEPPRITLDGRTYDLAPEIEWSVVEGAMVGGDEDAMRVGMALIRSAFGEGYEEFVERERPTVADLEAIAEFLNGEYGMPGGEGGERNGATPDPSRSSKPG
jgi:hypothetical protein